MAALPAINRAYEEEYPQLGPTPAPAGAFWQPDFRDRFPIASDEIHNHDETAFLGVLDGTEGVTDWNPWEGRTGPEPGKVIRPGYGDAFAPGDNMAGTLQMFRNSSPLAIDAFDRSPDHAQLLASGADPTAWVAGAIPATYLPNSLPYHYDLGDQIDTGQAIGPRQVFRQPPSISDQTAAVYAAGF